jgi:integrase
MTNKYVVPKLAGIPVSQLKSEHLRELLTTIESTPAMIGGRVPRALSGSEEATPEDRRKRQITANNTLSFVKSALEMAWEEGKIADNNPWRRVKRFRRVDRSRTKFLTLDQVRQLLQVSSPEMRRLILAAVYTGARISEILALRVQDVCTHRRAIYVEPQKTYRGRHVALPDEAYDFFNEIAQGKRPQDRLLIRDKGTPWVSSCLPAQKIKTAYEDIGLPKCYVFHSLRHTYATQLILCGTPLVVIARQMGHANIMSVVRFYLHCVDDFYDDELREKFKPDLRRNLIISPPDD